MSLIFEALKKGRGEVTPFILTEHANFVSDAPQQLRTSPVKPILPEVFGSGVWPWPGLILALFTGLVLAGGGVWLYRAGQSSSLNLSSSVEPVRVAIMTKPAVTVEQVVPAKLVLASSVSTIVLPSSSVDITPMPVERVALASPPVTVVAILKPATTATAVPLAPASSGGVVKLDGTEATSGVAMDPSVKTLKPEPTAVVKLAAVPPLNTQVQLTSDTNSFDVREAFQAFVQLLQMGKLPEAQMAADKFTNALGGNHVMSLRAQGYLAFKKNDLGKAKGHYLQLQQLLPEDREAGLNLGLIDWRQGEKDSAAKRVARLLEKFPNDPEIQALYFNVRNP